MTTQIEKVPVRTTGEIHIGTRILAGAAMLFLMSGLGIFLVSQPPVVSSNEQPAVSVEELQYKAMGEFYAAQAAQQKAFDGWSAGVLNAPSPEQSAVIDGWSAGVLNAPSPEQVMVIDGWSAGVFSEQAPVNADALRYETLAEFYAAQAVQASEGRQRMIDAWAQRLTELAKFYLGE